MTPSRNCYIDCTGTFNSGQNTGIQRVVRNIVSKSARLKGLRGYTFAPVISMGAELYVLPEDFRGSYPLTRATNNLLGIGWNLLERVFDLDKKKPAAPVPATGHQGTASTVEGRVLAKVQHALVSAFRKALPFILRLPPFLDIVFSGGRKVQLQEGDIFFVADSFWNVNSFNAGKKAKERKATVILLVYDIIPITHPAFFDQTTRFLFQDYFPRYLELADGVVAISKFTKDEVARYCASIGFGREIALDYFYLGADFLAQPAIGRTEAPDTGSLPAASSFLMVGTIEPRKNHLLVIDAFERLWETGAETRLKIVGRVGWKSDQILDRIRGSRFFNRNLFYHESLSDADLSVLMSEATAVIQASMVEGFGLPLIEAMHMRKTVLASDIPVFREIGGDYPIYFSLDDVETLMEKIVLVGGGNHSRENIDVGWITWDESVRTLLGKVIDMAEGRA